MTRLRVLKPAEFLRALRKAGFQEVHQRGSHVVMVHCANGKRISVPFHGGRDISRALVKKILEEAELTERDLRRYL